MRAPDKKAGGETTGTVQREQKDIALVHGVTADGGYQILRRRGETLEFGSVHPLREGQPLNGEVVALKPRKDFPQVCDVQTIYRSPELGRNDTAAPALAARAHVSKGPAQVSSDSYRDNWDTIWSRPKKNDAPN